MAQKSASVIAAKWARAMQGATQSMKDGVAAVTESPMEKAAAAQDLWAAGVLRARENGKYADNLRAVPLEAWKRAFLQKGIGRVSAGVTEAMPVMEDFMSQLLPIAEASKRDVATMPKGTPEDSKQRMLRNFENMSRFTFKRRR